MLSQAQAHYLANVMRRKIGDEIEVFNGEDGAFAAHIVTLDKRKGTVKIDHQTSPVDEGPAIHLAYAPIKRGPTEILVQKATELGVASLTPVRTARTVAKPANEDRLAAISIEAAEQSERVSVPVFNELVSLELFLGRLDHRLIFADEAGDDPDARWGGRNGHAPLFAPAFIGNGREPVSLLIGPEGGFTPDERQAIRAHQNAIPISLGPLILKAETAAITTLSLIRHAMMCASTDNQA